MDLRQLKYYKEIIEQQSISKAAAHLHMAQPPLSMLLKDIEQQYGMPLIKRYREKWEVTEAGWVLYEHAKKMLHDAELIDLKMKYLREGLTGVISVGLSSSCLHLVRDILHDFSVRYPDSQIHLTQTDSAQVEQLLFHNDIDVALLLKPKTIAPYQIIKLQSSPFAVAMPASLEASIQTLKDIEKYPFIFLGAMEGYSMREEILHFLQEQDIHLRVVAECKDNLLVRQLVAQGMGISILPMIDDVHHDICYLPIPELATKIEPVLLYKKEVELSAACQRFIKLFVE